MINDRMETGEKVSAVLTNVKTGEKRVIKGPEKPEAETFSPVSILSLIMRPRRA